MSHMSVTIEFARQALHDLIHVEARPTLQMNGARWCAMTR
jgi:hypothetical protein